MWSLFGLLFGAVAWAGNTPQATYDSVDYLVVGGGTSGLVLARRLSEDPTSKFCYRMGMGRALAQSSEGFNADDHRLQKLC